MSKIPFYRLTDVHSHAVDSPIHDLSACKTGRICLMSAGLSDWSIVEKISRIDPKRFVEFYGVHPWFSGTLHSDWLIDLEDQLTRSPNALVGEIGLDGVATDSKTGLKYDFDTQMNVFIAQYDLAAKLNRSVSIHAVQVAGKMYDFLAKHDKSPPCIALHSFNGSPDMIKRLVKLKGVGSKIYFSLSSLVNLRSKRLKEMVLSIPEDKILIESDCHDILSIDGQLESIFQEISKVKDWDIEKTISILERNTANYFKA